MRLPKLWALWWVWYTLPIPSNWRLFSFTCFRIASVFSGCMYTIRPTMLVWLSGFNNYLFVRSFKGHANQLLSDIGRFCNASLFRVVVLEVIRVLVDFQEQWWKTGSRPSMFNSRRLIRGNLSGLFLTVNCESLWGLLLLKSSCLLSDLSWNALGMYSYLCEMFLLLSLLLYLMLWIHNLPFFFSILSKNSTIASMLQAYDWGWEKSP